MSPLFEFKTLKPAPFSYGIFLNAFVAFLLVTLIGEFVLRFDCVRGFLPSPNYGSGSPEFGIKLRKADLLYTQKGKIDCIFMGSSVMDADVDPEIFNSEYYALTHQELICFNFSLAGFPPSSAYDVAQFLVKRYQPKVIFYGVAPGEFTPRFNNRPVYSTEWVSFHNSLFSIEGWLLETSFTYRYSLPLMRYVFISDYRRLYNAFEKRLSRHGHDRLENSLTIGPISIGDTPYKIDPESFRGYQGLINLNSSSTKIIIIEEPLHPIVFPNYLHGGEEAYQKDFLQPVLSELFSRQIDFWATNPDVARLLSVDTAWADAAHLNFSGAEIFSRWLARQYVDTFQVK